MREAQIRHLLNQRVLFLQASQQCVESRVGVEHHQRERYLEVPVLGAELAAASVDELAHLIDLEDVLLGHLLAHFVIVTLRIAQILPLPSLQHLEEGALEPSLECELSQLGCRQRPCVLGVIDVAEHVVLDDLPRSDLVGAAVGSEAVLVLQVVTEEVVVALHFYLHSSLQSQQIAYHNFFFESAAVRTHSAGSGRFHAFFAFVAGAFAAGAGCRSASHLFNMMINLDRRSFLK